MYAMIAYSQSEERAKRLVRKKVANHLNLSSEEMREHDEIWRALLMASRLKPVAIFDLEVALPFKVRAIAQVVLPIAINPFLPRNSVGSEFGRTAIWRPDVMSFTAYAQNLFENVPHQLFPILIEFIRLAAAWEKKTYLTPETTSFLLCALTILPEDDEVATELFKLFSLGPSRPIDYGKFGPFDPFYQLLNDGRVPQKFKYLADMNMREIISGEAPISASNETESAIFQYARIVEYFSHQGRLPYAKSLFDNQVRYLLDLEVQANRAIIDTADADVDMFDCLDDRDIKLAFARRAFLGVNNRSCVFALYSRYKPRVRLARQIVREFGAEDVELGRVCENLLKTYQEKRRVIVLKERTNKNNERRNLQELLQLMK